MRAALPAAVSALAAAAICGAAMAQAPVSERGAAGRQVAGRFCSECHAVEAGGVSPLATAPPMSELYRSFPVERIGEALAAGLIERHSTWLQQKLDAEERAALTEYLSLFAPAEREVYPPEPGIETRGMRIAGL